MGMILNPFRFASAFSPLDIAGLAAWYAADDASTITTSGSEVTQWDDKSGNSRDLTPGTYTGPSTGTRTQNGMNVLDYSGSQGLGRSDFLYGLGSYTMFVVFVCDAASGQANISGVVLGESTTSDDDGLGLRMVNSGTQGLFYFDDNVGGLRFLVEDVVTSGTWRLVTGWDNTTSASIYTDGVLAAFDSSYTRTTLTTNRFGVGMSQYSGGDRGLDGAIAEVLIYDSALGTSDREAVEDYLMTKWGL